jgi:hypothetical protein
MPTTAARCCLRDSASSVTPAAGLRRSRGRSTRHVRAAATAWARNAGSLLCSCGPAPVRTQSICSSTDAASVGCVRAWVRSRPSRPYLVFSGHSCRSPPGCLPLPRFRSTAVAQAPDELLLRTDELEYMVLVAVARLVQPAVVADEELSMELLKRVESACRHTPGSSPGGFTVRLFRRLTCQYHDHSPRRNYYADPARADPASAPKDDEPARFDFAVSCPFSYSTRPPCSPATAAARTTSYLRALRA